MKINVIKKNPKDTFYSLLPINWILRITCLSNIYRKGNKLAKAGSIIKIVIYVTGFGLFNVYCFHEKLKIMKIKKLGDLFTFVNFYQITYWLSYFEYIIDIFIVYKHRVTILANFKTFDDSDTIIGSPYFDKIRKKLTYDLIFGIAISLFVSIFTFVAWAMVLGWHFPLIDTVDHIYFLFNMFTVLDVVSHVIQVEYRLKKIGDLLQNTTIQIKPVVDVNLDDVSAKIAQTADRPLGPLQTQCQLDTSWLTRCYLLILQQVDVVNISYGFRVMVYFINMPINMIIWAYTAFGILNGNLVQTTNINTVLLFLCNLVRVIYYDIISMLLVCRCEQTYKESDSILDTIDKLLTNNNNHSDLKSNLLEIRNLLLSRPIKFHGANFFKIDYTLLVSINSVVLTYTIIMLQSMQ